MTLKKQFLLSIYLKNSSQIKDLHVMISLIVFVLLIKTVCFHKA